MDPFEFPDLVHLEIGIEYLLIALIGDTSYPQRVHNHQCKDIFLRVT